VLMSDMQVVARSVEIKYKDFATLESPGIRNRPVSACSKYGWNFLQKIIQLQFDLPIYPAAMIRKMLQDLARQVPEKEHRGRWPLFWPNFSRNARSLFDKISFSRVWSVIGVISALVAVSAIVVRVLPIRMRFLAWVAFFASAWAVGIWLDRAILGIVRWTRESMRRKRIDEQIRTRIAAGERDFSRVEDYVKRQNSTRTDNREIEWLVRERLQRYLEDESELQREAEDEVMRYIEPMPRHAKRLLNRLRLLLFIAHERRMFGGTPKLSARHIGKWAVLGERWPDLLQEVCARPELMTLLEDAKKHDACVKIITPAYEDDDALREFCVSVGGVKLSPVIIRIVEFAQS
jgi:hypothetical protein